MVMKARGESATSIWWRPDASVVASGASSSRRICLVMGNSSGAGAWWWGRGESSVSGTSESRIYGSVVSVNRQKYTVDMREYIVVWMWPTRGGLGVSKGVGPGVDVTLVAKMARRESVCREFAPELECREDCSIFRSLVTKPG